MDIDPFYLSFFNFCLHFISIHDMIHLVLRTQHNIGVWLSLARAPGLGPGGRRFESCHPDYMRV